MREIEFRGKRLDNREWVYGDLSQGKYGTKIRNAQNDVCVIPETIGQYTGLKDSNGVKIFEGDIVRVSNNMDEPYTGEIYFDHCAWFIGEPITLDIPGNENRDYCDIEVIGNIHDNPELL